MGIFGVGKAELMEFRVQMESERWIENGPEGVRARKLSGRMCQESCGSPSFRETLIIDCVAVVGSKALSVKAP